MQPQSFYQYLLLIGLWLFTSNAFANSAIYLSDESFNYSISPYLSIYEDTSKELTIDEISSLEYLLLFSPSHAKTIKLGISDSFFWLRFSATNPYDKPMRAIFSLSGSDYDLINFYLLKPDGSPQYYSTDHFERSIKGGLLQKHTLLISLPANTTNTYLLQAHSNGLIASSAYIQSIDTFVTKEQSFFSILGASIGLLIGAGLFFIYLWCTFRLLIALPALALTILITLYITSGLGYLEVVTSISAFTADKLSELALGLIGLVHISAALSLKWSQRQRAIRLLILSTGLAIIPLSLAVLIVLPVAAMPVIATLVMTGNTVLVLTLFFTTSTNLISQRWLRFSYSVSAIGVFITLLTRLNLLGFDGFTTWSQISVPLGVILFLLFACIAQIPRTNLHYRNQAQGNLPSQYFLSTQVSNELRTPINSILSISDLLQDTPQNQQQRDLNSLLEESGRQLLHAANQIDNISNLYTDEITLNKQPVNLIQLVNQSLSDLQPEASRRKVELILDYCENLPLVINSDPTRLFIIIHNILRRALTYTEHGEINVSIKPLPTHTGFGVLLQVQLSSTIIRPEELRNSFSVLQHQDSLPSNANYEWYLLLTRFLMKKMNARLEVESLTLQGASLSLVFSFPKELIAEQAAPISGIIDDKQLLIVDDNASLRSVLEKQAKRWGLQVSTTYNSKEALTMLRTQANLKTPYDFMVVDQDMPTIDGFELAKRIQQDDDIQPKPAIVMLASCNVNEIREEAYNAGIAIALAKPAYPEHLRQALQDLLPATQPVNRGK